MNKHTGTFSAHLGTFLFSYHLMTYLCQLKGEYIPDVITNTMGSPIFASVSPRPLLFAQSAPSDDPRINSVTGSYLNAVSSMS